jgi:inorganic pyrophosphatase/exopolyphosphatase
VYFGEIGAEIIFVKAYTKSFSSAKHIGNYSAEDKFVLVDVADPTRIDPRINPSQVIKIFDHDPLVFLDKFINSENHIELVGSCATLIAEEFKKVSKVPTLSSAIYLHSAIISNTVNFKYSVTTVRDIDAAAWLKKITGLDDKYIIKMFENKSKISAASLPRDLYIELAVKTLFGKKIAIVQIEMVNVDSMGSELNQVLLQTLLNFKEEYALDYIFFSGIDVIKGFNVFYTIDEKSRRLFSSALCIPNLKPGYKTDQIIMRKQIWPKVEKVVKEMK